MKQPFYVSLLTALDLTAANCKKTLLSSFLFIGLSSVASGQAGTLNLFNAPQSPNAASLGKFVEIPVGHYSGIPNISVPLYEWDIKGLKIPISLSYHASGVKVKEIPGAVGTNWALNAGGVITRIVRGHPDDHDPSEDDSYDSIYRRRVVNAINSGYSNEFSLNERYDLCLSAPRVTAVAVNNGSYPFNRMDTEIDLFYFNFLGYTGQFTFTNEGKPMLLSNTDLKIDYNNRKFKITDGNGIQYFFDSTEQSLDEAVTSNRLYNTSWYISKIFIPQSNQTITFSYNRYWNNALYPSNIYEDYGAAFYSRIDRIRYMTYVVSNYTYGNGGGGCPPYDRISPSTLPHYFSNNLFINEINWNGNKIKFYGSTNRTDLYKYKFDSIKVTSNGELIRKIDLNYSYFNNSSQLAGQKKLKLDKVIINDQQYQFGYVESLYGKTLPIITSTGQDMWGYYNGEDDENNIPHYKVLDDPNMDPNIFHYIGNGASGPKNPDYKYGQIGTLNSLTWPTGGKTIFTYEGNDYSYYPFVDPGYTIVTDPFTQMEFDSLIIKSFNTYTIPGVTTNGATKEREFVLHKDQTITLELTLGQFPFETLQQYNDSVLSFATEAHATLLKYNSSTGQFENIITYDVFPIDSIGHPTDEGVYELVKNKGLLNGVYTHTLTEGRYKWFVELYGWYMVGDVGVGCVFPYKKDTNIYNAGGIRVKKIEFISRTDTDTSYVKNYEYKTETASSGVLESPFANISTSAFVDELHYGELPGCSNCYFQESCGFLDLSSNPVIPLGNSQGGVIGYSKVTEIREDNSKIVSYFTNGQDDPYSFADQFAQSPLLATRTRITTDNSWKRGLFKQMDYYNNAGQLQKQDFSRYEFDDSRLYNRSVSLALDNVVLYGAGQTAGFNGYNAVDFYTIRGNQNALKIEDSTVQYAPTGNINEVTKYEYHSYSFPHSYPIKVTNRNSRGEYTITTLKYPQDYTVGSSPTNATAISIKNLLDRHVTAPYIEKYVQKMNSDGSNLRTVSGQYVRYKQTLPYPDTVFNLRITAALTNFQTTSITSGSDSKDTRYKPVINFLQYDNYGNILEQARPNNVKEVFVWGYNHQYPVAKVAGSTYNSVMGMIDANIINNPGSEQQLQTELNKIRTGLASSQALVSTYAYKPLIGLISEIDATGKKLYYDYDQFGRLALVRDQNKKILKKICYNYSGQPENCAWFGNAQVSQNFTRNNCTNDSIGGQATYIVQANTYYASTQAAANDLAQTDINTNGQKYANESAACSLMTWYSERVYGDFYSELCWPDEPQPYYVDVPAGTFTSHISPEDATDQAWWWAQGQANANGQCIDYVDLILNNNNPWFGSNFYVRLTNVNAPYQQYEFLTFYGYGWLGRIPAGTYDIEIYPWNPGTGYYFFNVGCWYYGDGDGFNFYSVDIADGCAEITVD